MNRGRFLVSMLLVLFAAPGGAAFCDDPPALAFTRPATASSLGAPELLSPASGELYLRIESVFLSWTEVEEATGYNFEVERFRVDPIDDATPGCTLNRIVTEPYFEIPALTLPPGGYRWSVRALGEDVIGPTSEERIFDVTLYCRLEAELPFTLPATTQDLAAPQLISPLQEESHFVDEAIPLEWSAVPGATAYNFDVDTNGCHINRVVSATSYTIPAYALFQQGYAWAVRALQDEEIGPKSERRVFNVFEEHFTPTPTATPTPTPDLDFSGNGRVDGEDTFLILSQWQQASDQYDLTSDGWVREEDLVKYLDRWRRRKEIPPTPVLYPPVLLQPLNAEEIIRDDILLILYDPNADNGVFFRWTKAFGADFYDVRFEGPSSGGLGVYWIRDVSGTELKVTLPITTQNSDLGTYRWQVRSASSALAESGYSALSEPYFFDIINPTFTPTPTPTPVPKSADIDQDGSVRPLDLFLFASSWQLQSSSPGYLEDADFDSSGRIEAEDLLGFVSSQQRRSEEAVFPPLLLAPTDGWVAYTAEVLDATLFSWRFQAVPAAAGYEAEVYNAVSLGDDPDLVDRFVIPEDGRIEYHLTEQLTPWPVGGKNFWFWRVRAWGETGRVSPWSETRTFEVRYGVRPDSKLSTSAALSIATPTPGPGIESTQRPGW